MIVGICSFDLHLPQNHSLKGKRQVVRSVKDRVRNSFNVSIAEIGSLDSWQRSILGVTCISRERTQVDRLLSRVVNFVDGLHVANVENVQVEIL